MDTAMVGEVLREGIFIVIKICAPMLLLSMSVGVLLAIFQAVTQIHEQSISFMLKLLVVVSVLLLAGGWMMETLQDYARALFDLMAG